MLTTSAISTLPRSTRSTVWAVSLLMLSCGTSRSDDASGSAVISASEHLTTPYGVAITPAPSYGYTGHEVEAQMAALDFGARMYRADLGRFLEPDPVYDPERSPYNYVEGQPTTRVDPDGRRSRRACCEDDDPTPADRLSPEQIDELRGFVARERTPDYDAKLLPPSASINAREARALFAQFAPERLPDDDVDFAGAGKRNQFQDIASLQQHYRRIFAAGATDAAVETLFATTPVGYTRLINAPIWLARAGGKREIVRQFVGVDASVLAGRDFKGQLVRHALKRKIQTRVRSADYLDTVRHPLFVLETVDSRPARAAYWVVGRNATVVIDRNRDTVITVWSRADNMPTLEYWRRQAAFMVDRPPLP